MATKAELQEMVDCLLEQVAFLKEDLFQATMAATVKPVRLPFEEEEPKPSSSFKQRAIVARAQAMACGMAVKV